MPTLLIRHARLLVTMDAQRREIADGAVFVRDGVIEQVGASLQLPSTADEVIDAHGQVVIPGLVNTHHHMYQTLTRVVPAAQDIELFGWLKTLYPIWAKLTPGDGAREHADGDGRAAAVGLHHQQRPPVHLPQWGDAGRQHRCGGRDRHALPRRARLDERGRQRRRACRRTAWSRTRRRS